MEKSETIKVSKKIKPIHVKDREQVELVIGNEYYISFGCNLVEKCTLAKINKDNTVSIRTADAGYRVFPDEISLTPEQAVMYRVTQ